MREDDTQETARCWIQLPSEPPSVLDAQTAALISTLIWDECSHAHAHQSDHITASLCVCHVQSCSLQQQLITDRIQHLALSTGYNHTTAVLKWYSWKSVRWSFLTHDPEDDALPLSEASLQEAVVGEKVDVTGSECGSGGTVFLWMLIGLKFCLPQ